MPRNYFHGKLIDGGTIDPTVETTLFQKPYRALTSRNFIRGKRVGGDFFGGQSQEDYISYLFLTVAQSPLTFTAQDLSLVFDESFLFVDPASMFFQGQTLDLLIANALTVDASSVTYTGQDLSLTNFGLNIDASSLTFTADTIDLDVGSFLTVDPASITFTGADIGIDLGLVLTVDPIVLTFDGVSIDMPLVVELEIDSAPVTFTGADISFELGLELQIDSAAFTLAGSVIAPLSLDRTVTLGRTVTTNGNIVGYSGGLVGGAIGSVSNDIFNGETVTNVYQILQPSISDIRFEVILEDNTLTSDTFDGISVEVASGDIITLFTDDASFTTVLGSPGAARWIWTDEELWAVADDAEIFGWEIF